MDRLHKVLLVLVLSLCFLVPFAGVRGAAEEEQDELVGLVNMKECEGVAVTQCEVAKNLINTLKMGEDLTCGACFNHLQALGIAPGEDWSYEDPHKVMIQKEMKEVVLEVQMAYNKGTVRLDGFEVAAGINDFCRNMKGPIAPPAPSGQQEKETEMQPDASLQGPQDQGPVPTSGVETEAAPPTTTAQKPGKEEEETSE